MGASCLCRHCGAVIGTDDINVATDLALCRACGRSMPYSSIAATHGLPEVDLSSPPAGLRIEHDLIKGIRMTWRKLNPIVFFLIPFTALWSGLSLWGIYGHQIADGKFDLATSLMGLPFVFGTLVLVSVILFMLAGQHRVGLDRGYLETFSGVGSIGRRRRIPFGPGSNVRLIDSQIKVNRIPQHLIAVTTGDQTLRFGTMLPHNARLFIAAALQKAARP
jgi:hypothetical protein